MRSKLRKTYPSTDPAPKDGTAYLMIYSAVRHQDGLIHGMLHDGGRSCAIGSFFNDNPKLALNTSLIDEVAMVNDSVPHMSAKQRREHVSRWLRWKLQQCGLNVPGKVAK